MALLFKSDSDNADRWRRACLSLSPDLDFRVWPEIGRREDIEAALVWAPESGALTGFPNLKAIFSLGAGVDGLLQDRTLPDVPLCRMVDPSLTKTMSDFVLMAVLHRFREVDRYARDQHAGRWQFAIPRDTADCAVGIMGLGELGLDAARTLRSRGFDVRAWARSPRAFSDIRVFQDAEGLEPFLSELEILVCMLPLTSATRGILDKRVFEKLPKGAYLINVARGGHLVDDDLLASLDAGHLGGALLDVFETEPPDLDHRFWRHPRISMTPHVASYCLPEIAARGVVANYERLIRGEPLEHVVDRARGY